MTKPLPDYVRLTALAEVDRRIASGRSLRWVPDDVYFRKHLDEWLTLAEWEDLVRDHLRRKAEGKEAFLTTEA